MAEENKGCRMRIWEDQDSSRWCNEPGAEKVGEHWYCAHCLPAAKTAYAEIEECERNAIVVTSYGERIVQHGRYSETRGLTSSTVHEICRGWIDHTQVSKKYAVLTCRKCGLRVYIKSSIKTWSELKLSLWAIQESIISTVTISSHRWNWRGDEVCKGEHARSDPCEWEKATPWEIKCRDLKEKT